ncbi:MAG: DHA2 family efflux MFS transporter permease subunit [Lautropia mirabilis]|nr:DHA2 family efflux MFS transporter permease subunit [Lautropia mirabilis]
MPSSRQYEYFDDDPSFPSTLVISTLFVGAFIGFLNETLLNVALPTLMREFSVEKTTVQWMVTGFMLVMGALAPLTASLVQWLDTRRLTLVTLGTFLAGSLICATAPSFGLLLTGRLVQAVSAALTMPLLMNATLAIYPPERRGKVMGLVAMVFSAAPALGPTISGFIIDHFGWRWLFLLTVPLMLVAVLLVLRYLKVTLVEITRPRIDLLSVVLSVLGFGGLVYGGSTFSEASALQLAVLLPVSLLMVGAFVVRQFRLKTPLLNLRAFGHAQFGYAVIVRASNIFLFLGMELLMPMYAQQVLMLSATVTGLILLPGSIVQAFLMPVFGTLLDRRGGRFVVLPGTVFILISLLGMWLSFDATSRAWWLATLFGLFSAAGAAAMVSETYGLNALPRNLNPHGAAIMATLNPIAGALGAAFFVGVTHLGERLAASAAGGTTKTTLSMDSLRPALELGQAGGQGAAIDTTAHAAATAGGALTEAARDTMLDGLHLAFGLAPFVALLMLWAASRFHRKGQ